MIGSTAFELSAEPRNGPLSSGPFLLPAPPLDEQRRGLTADRHPYHASYDVVGARSRFDAGRCASVLGGFMDLRQRGLQFRRASASAPNHATPNTCISARPRSKRIRRHSILLNDIATGAIKPVVTWPGCGNFTTKPTVRQDAAAKQRIACNVLVARAIRIGMRKIARVRLLFPLGRRHFLRKGWARDAGNYDGNHSDSAHRVLQLS